MSACWPWTGPLTKKGYALTTVQRRRVSVHRAAYEALVGPIPPGLELDHLCRVRHCYNPAHLEPVTHAENVRRGLAGRPNRDKTECRNGHAYTDENTYTDRAGSRHCRACDAARKRARYMRRPR